MDGRWDAVVIGSGVGGLAAATMGGMMAAASVEPAPIELAALTRRQSFGR